MVAAAMTVVERAEQLVSLIIDHIEPVPMEGDSAMMEYHRPTLVKLVGEALTEGASDASFEAYQKLSAENATLREAVASMAAGTVMALTGEAAKSVDAITPPKFLNQELSPGRAKQLLKELGFLGIVDLVTLMAIGMDGSIEASGPRVVVKIKKRSHRVKSTEKLRDFCQAKHCRERRAFPSEFCEGHQELEGIAGVVVEKDE